MAARTSTASVPWRPFSTLLVANRGEIALRVLRAAHAMGLRTVAVFSDPDADAPHVRAADEAVRLPGATAGDTYLDAQAILAAARSTGADAVHPGYGFLSESPAFAAEVQAAGLVWVGPPVTAMEAMAGKVEAKRRMAAVGVPTLPSAVVGPGEEQAAAEVGFPLLVKASAGGGGRGMRLVAGPDELTAAVGVAAREAAAAFGDPTLFVERHLARPRHVEVQVLGDAHGTVVHLGDRECSIQRRHQKVLEEAPAPWLGEDLRQAMTAAAVSGAEALGYVGAGTMEFLVDGDEFFFLEMNTRLQVEHPVTEEVTGLDLVRLQLLVAMGEPLPLTQADVQVRGHAIEARLYAEDPAAGWLPSTGVIHRFEPAEGPGLRWDAGVESGSVVSTHYDAMLAKAVAVAPTRREAAGSLARALSGSAVEGVTTNLDLLVDVLGHADFLEQPSTTAFLDEHPELLARALDSEVARRHLLAAALAGAAERRVASPLATLAPPGWRNLSAQPQEVDFEQGEDEHAATHRVAYRCGAGGRVEATVAGHEVEARVRARVGGAADEGGAVPVHLDLEVGGILRRYEVRRRGRRCFVQGPDGRSTFHELPRFADRQQVAAVGGLHAPLPGTVVSVLVASSDLVAAGQVLVVLEAMKVEHQICAVAAGEVVAVLVEPGAAVDAHAPLVEVEAG